MQNKKVRSILGTAYSLIVFLVFISFWGSVCFPVYMWSCVLGSKRLVKSCYGTATPLIYFYCGLVLFLFLTFFPLQIGKKLDVITRVLRAKQNMLLYLVIFLCISIYIFIFLWCGIIGGFEAAIQVHSNATILIKILYALLMLFLMIVFSPFFIVTENRITSYIKKHGNKLKSVSPYKADRDSVRATESSK